MQNLPASSKQPQFSYADPADPPLRKLVIRAIERATGQKMLKRLYCDYRDHAIEEPNFFQGAIERLKIDVRFDAGKLAKAPKTGPVVFVANHPYGVLDGIIISWLVSLVRMDFVVLTNAVLLKAPEIRPHVLPVDFSGTPEATKINLETRERARKHLEAGGCVVVFPAGGVSTAPDRLGMKPAVDAPWQPFTAQLIQRSKATVVPVCFAGQNSRLFQIASHLSQTLRLSLIFREVKNRMGTVLPVAIGDPLPYESLKSISDRKALATFLMNHTYSLTKFLPPARPRGLAMPRKMPKILRKSHAPAKALIGFMRVLKDHQARHGLASLAHGKPKPFIHSILPSEKQAETLATPKRKSAKLH